MWRERWAGGGTEHSGNGGGEKEDEVGEKEEG